MNNDYEFEWYVFTNDNRDKPIAGFINKDLALEFMNILADGAIIVNKIWFNKKVNKIFINNDSKE